MGKFKHTCTISFVIDTNFDDPHMAVHYGFDDVVPCLMERVAELVSDQDKFERDLRLFGTKEDGVITEFHMNAEDR